MASNSADGFEYKPSYIDGFGTGSITWMQNGKRMWRVSHLARVGSSQRSLADLSRQLQISDKAMKANAASMVSNRGVTGEFRHARAL